MDYGAGVRGNPQRRRIRKLRVDWPWYNTRKDVDPEKAHSVTAGCAFLIQSAKESMNPTVITALISGLCVAIPTLISVVVTSNTRDAVNEERIKNLSSQIQQLSVKVQLHNNFETRIAVIERDLKTAFNKLDELRGMK